MPDGRLRQPFSDRVATAIWLDHNIDFLNADKVLGVPVFTPVRRAGDAKRRDAVAPERLNVELALNQDDLTGVAGIAETVEAVELRLRAGLPTKAVAFQGNPETDGQNLAAVAEVRNANNGAPS